MSWVGFSGNGYRHAFRFVKDTLGGDHFFIECLPGLPELNDYVEIFAWHFFRIMCQRVVPKTPKEVCVLLNMKNKKKPKREDQKYFTWLDISTDGWVGPDPDYPKEL